MKKKRKGFTLVELLVVIAIIALLMSILMPALNRVRHMAFRMVCGSNLSGIGKAMLIYANDYDDDFPRAGYAMTTWGEPISNWQATSRSAAYASGRATITSCLYLLVKYSEVTPKSFCCKGEPTTDPFRASDFTPLMEDEDAWDFGPDDATNKPLYRCSYSYHMPYDNSRTFALSTASSEPGLAVAADRNPWFDNATDTTGFNWKHQEAYYQKRANSAAHQREGQNVLFMDIHVSFEKRAFCAIDDDNIYTWFDSEQPQQGSMVNGIVGYTEKPKFAVDSWLVNEVRPGAAP